MTSAVGKLFGTDSPRADAQRNAGRLVAAAREAIAEVGVEVTAHEIARRAGVGIGTFYRRLPSREALLNAVLADLIAEIVRHADDALQDPDPWHGFAGFAAEFARLRAASCGIHEAMSGKCTLSLDGSLATLRERIHDLVRRAQEAGVLRTDIRWQDVPFLLGSVVTDETTIGIDAAEDQWLRNLRVVLDGLRTPNRAREAP